MNVQLGSSNQHRFSEPYAGHIANVHCPSLVFDYSLSNQSLQRTLNIPLASRLSSCTSLLQSNRLTKPLNATIAQNGVRYRVECHQHR
jgi:hypothetical protein